MREAKKSWWLGPASIKRTVVLGEEDSLFARTGPFETLLVLTVLIYSKAGKEVL
jgi:hypothetical protein